MPIDAKLATALDVRLAKDNKGKKYVSPVTEKNFYLEMTDRGRFLNLSSCGIASIDGLDHKAANKLQELVLVNNKVADIEPLARRERRCGAEQLTYLDLRDNPLEDLTPLGELTALRTLYLTLTGNGNVCLEFLADLTNLRTLWIEGGGRSWREGDGELTGIDTIGRLTELRTLALNYCKLTDAALARLNNCGKSCEKLGGLWLRHNAIQTPTIGKLTSLTHVDLSYNEITKVTPLETLKDLRGLWLSDNNIEDLKPLTGLTNLRGLWAAQNEISDISPLAKLTNLMGLWLANNAIRDIGPLGALSIITLDVRNCELTKLPPCTYGHALFAQLRQIGLAGNRVTAGGYLSLPSTVRVDPPEIEGLPVGLQEDEDGARPRGRLVDALRNISRDADGRELDEAMPILGMARAAWPADDIGGQRLQIKMDALAQAMEDTKARYPDAVLRWVLFCFATQQLLSWTEEDKDVEWGYVRWIDANRLRKALWGRKWDRNKKGIVPANAELMVRTGEELVAALDSLKPEQCGPAMWRALDGGDGDVAECGGHMSYIDGRLAEPVRLCCELWPDWAE